MFDFIKKFFGGITAFFSGLLGGKKSQNNAIEASTPKAKKSKGYFLELDDTGNIKSPTEAKKPEPTKTEPAKAEPAKAEPVKAETQEPAKQAVAVKDDSKPTKDVPVENGKVRVEAQPNPPAAAANNGKVESLNEMTFAPKYLMPTASSGRRRPGPSMDTFRDMARQVKTPNQ